MTAMTRKVLVVDLDKCIRCLSCEIACKQENDLPLGVRWIRVVTIGPRIIKGELHMDFIPVMCLHCDDPVCAHFCPTKAIGKREDGVVTLDEDKCTGCRLCVYACPYGVMYFDQDKNVAGKCNLCSLRMDYGLEPSCVQHCIGGALQFLDIEKAKKIAEGRHRTGTEKVWYISNKCELSLFGKSNK